MDQPPLNLDVVAKADVIEPYAALIADFKKRVFRAPQPQVRNVEVSKALALTTPITPHMGDLIQGYLGGNITNLKSELVKLSDNFSRDLDSAIAKAKAAGADVSRADFEFSDWKRGEDYTY
jgi:multiple sugar transport system substrate-binding protein